MTKEKEKLLNALGRVQVWINEVTAKLESPPFKQMRNRLVFKNRLAAMERDVAAIKKEMEKLKCHN